MRRWWPFVAVSVAALAVVAGGVTFVSLARKRANYSRVEQGLYLGGRVPAPPPGTRAVLNLCRVDDSYQAEVHRWAPIPDAAPAPGIDWLRQQVEFIDRSRRAEMPVYVHCRAGVSRAGLVTVAYLMWREGWSRDEAMRLVRTRRARVRPNPAFMALLLEWEQSLDRAETRPVR
jgi:hypothetical protein